MPIQFENTQIPNLQFEGSSIKEVYFEDKLVYKKSSAEEFKIKINSGADGSFNFPMSSKYGIDNGLSYHNIIDWGDGNKQEISGICSLGNGILHKYSNINTEYFVTLKPFSSSETDLNGWGSCFGFTDQKTGCNDSSNKNKLLGLYSPFSKNMLIKDYSLNNIGASLFHRCAWLTELVNCTLPQDLITVGDNFCSGMFYGTKRLSNLNTFNIPQNIVNCGARFCSSMFHNSGFSHFNITIPKNLIINFKGVFLSMFGKCVNLETGVISFFNNVVYPQKTLDTFEVFSETFNGCPRIKETLSSSTIPQLQITPNVRLYTFLNDNAGSHLPLNWR